MPSTLPRRAALRAPLPAHELQDLIHNLLGWNLKGLAATDAQLNFSFLEGTAQNCHERHAEQLCILELHTWRDLWAVVK